MTTRNELERRIADLADDWEEQSRTLYWALRDLGGDPTRLIGESPFQVFARCPRAGAKATLPIGGIGV